MQKAFDLDAIANAMAMAWGREAIEVDSASRKIYIEFDGPVVTSLGIDCDRGVSHCVAELPNIFPLLPITIEERCIIANWLNINLVTKLGVSHHFHVLENAMHLSDVRSFNGTSDIVTVCEEQAHESASLMIIVVEKLAEYFRDAPPSTNVPLDHIVA